MANFCSKCGRPLADGEVCNCQFTSATPGQNISGENTTQQQVPFVNANQDPVSGGMPNQQGVPSQMPYQPAQPSAFSMFMNRLGYVLKNCITRPVDTFRSYASAGDFKVGLTFIGIEALAFGFFMLALFANIDSSIGGLTNMMGSSASSIGLGMPLASAFFLSFFLVVAFAFAFSGLLTLFGKVVFKSEITYKQALCVTGTKSLAAAPFWIVAIIILFLNISWGILFGGFGTILAYLYSYITFDEITSIDKNKKLYAMFFSFIALSIVMTIVINLTYKLYLPSSLRVITNFLG